jgi:signal peptidase II
MKAAFKLLVFVLSLLFFSFFDFFLFNKVRLSGGPYVCNRGISFSITINPFVFWLIFILFLFFVVLFIKKILPKKPLLASIALQILLIGVFLNIIDRFLYGCVVDYIYIKIVNFPLFNTGDVLITLGVFLLFPYLLTKPS